MRSDRKSILVVAGARPNFMKVAPLLHALARFPESFEVRLIHTGQHYDAGMSDVFFQELDLPQPDRFLGVGSGSHAEQTARIMVAFETVCVEEKPDLVVVVGDVNSTLACALTAKKLGIRVAHVEAGLRSRDWSMPEEINRIVTDRISDLLFTPSRDADENLLQEGIPPEQIHFVGNLMVDSLLAQLPKTEGRDTLQRFEVKPRQYATLTLHRPANVDDPAVFKGILEVIIELSERLPVVWPIHPRTRNIYSQLGLQELVERRNGLRPCEPLGYLDMLTLNRHARLILTDSGGLQEEATVLQVPCLTLRPNTERPVTVASGCNRIAGNRPESIRPLLTSVLEGPDRPNQIPELWDGRAASRVAEVLERELLLSAGENLPGAGSPMRKTPLAVTGVS